MPRKSVNGAANTGTTYKLETRVSFSTLNPFWAKWEKIWVYQSNELATHQIELRSRDLKPVRTKKGNKKPRMFLK